MSVVLFCPVTFNLAETTRMIEVARALDARHTPVFMGYERDYASLIDDAGFTYYPCEPSWSIADRQLAMQYDQGKSLVSPFTERLVAERVVVERKMIQDLNVSAVVIGSNITSMISARAEQVPLLYPVPFALTRPHIAGTRRLGLVPGTSWASQVADTMATSVFRWFYNHAPVAPKSFRKVARINQVPPLRTMASLLEADVNLLTVLPSEVEGYDLPPNYMVVGPIFARLQRQVPDKVKELAADHKPLIYLGLGSSASRRLVLKAARQLSMLPVNVIAPIKHYLRLGDTVPENVHVTELLPTHLLGRYVDAAVLHGGQGTVQAACAAGIPFVGMGLQPEQTWNVRVCEQRGNAISLPPQAVDGHRFVEAVTRVLYDGEIRTAAEHARREYIHIDGAAAAARIIDEVMK